MQNLAYPKVTPLYSSCCISYNYYSKGSASEHLTVLNLFSLSQAWADTRFAIFFVLRRRSGWK